MSKDYTIYRMESSHPYVKVEIVGETQAGLLAGIAEYLKEYKFHDARVEQQSGTTAIIKRWYKL
jgi:hypothetical protein